MWGDAGEGRGGWCRFMCIRIAASSEQVSPPYHFSLQLSVPEPVPLFSRDWSRMCCVRGGGQRREKGIFWGLAMMTKHAGHVTIWQGDSDWREAMRARREARMVSACSPCTNIRSGLISLTFMLAVLFSYSVVLALIKQHIVTCESHLRCMRSIWKYRRQKDGLVASVCSICKLSYFSFRNLM